MESIGLSVNTQYTFSVKARNEDNDETASVSSSVYSSQNIPTGITFDSVTASSITLSAQGTFSNLTSDSSGLYFFNATNSDTPSWLQINSWTNSSLNPNTQYSYQAKSRNGDGDETSYCSASAKYTLANAPAAPTVNNANPTTLDVNVNPNSNPASTEFTIYKETGASCDGTGGSYLKADGSDSATAVWQNDATWAAVTATGLSETTQYTFCTKARNGDNTETAFDSGASGTTTASNQTPNIPTLVSPADASYTTNNTPALSANYSDPDAGDAGTTNYRIAASASNCLNGTVITSGTSSATSDEDEDTNWTPSSSIGSDATYYWCAQNDDGAAQSAWTSMGSFTLDTTAPTNIDVSSIIADSSTQLTITAQTATDATSGLHSTPYWFNETTGSSGATDSSAYQTAIIYIDTGLTPNTQYTYQVKAKDAVGNESSYSSTLSKYTLANVPTSLSLTSDSSTQITASWNANSNPANTEYYIENTTAGTNSGWITSTSWASSDLTCGTNYSFKVKGRNGDNTETSYTSSASVETSGCGGGMPPGAFNPPAPPKPTPENPESNFSILINNNDKYTDDETVTLKLNAGSDTTRMAISNTPDFKNASIISYQSEITWDLCEGQEEGVCKNTLRVTGYTLYAYAKFYTQYGISSEVVSDSIILDTITQEEEIELDEPIEIDDTKDIENIEDTSWSHSPDIAVKPKTQDPQTQKPIEPDKPSVVDKITDKIIDIFKPEPEPEIPIEDLVSKETPIVMKGGWNLLPQEQINEFVLSPLPSGVERLAQKFPELQKTFEELGIDKITDFEKLRNIKLTLPGLTKSLGLTKKELNLVQNLPISKLPQEIKDKIPSEIIFAKIGGEKNTKSVDFNIELTVNDQGKTRQKIRAISGKKLFLTIKPEKKAKSVTGYLAFVNKNQAVGSTALRGLWSQQFQNLFNSYVFARPVFAEDYDIEIEEKFITQKFAYTDEDGDGIWTAEIYTPTVEGEYEIMTLIEYEDPELGTRMVKLTTVVDPEGYVYERVKNQELRIANAVVSIYKLNSENGEYELWQADNYNQKNPRTTDKTGRYSFLVPEGTYYLSIEAPGYSSHKSDSFTVQEGAGVHQNIELKAKNAWIKIIDWKVAAIFLLFILVVWNFYRDRRRK